MDIRDTTGDDPEENLSDPNPWVQYGCGKALVCKKNILVYRMVQ